jgi:hypothetical protein
MKTLHSSTSQIIPPNKLRSGIIFGNLELMRDLPRFSSQSVPELVDVSIHW